MKILAVSRAYPPSLGGLETAAAALTRAWTEAGHEVVVATRTPGRGEDEDGPSVLRRPSRRQLLAATRWSDLVWHNNISLRAAWTLALAPRPWVITHQGWLSAPRGSLSMRNRLKRFIAARAHTVAISNAVAAHLPMPAAVIPNPYRDGLFRDLGRPRSFDLAFLGRLVSDKGADLLLSALSILKRDGSTPRLLMIGDGPERGRLCGQARQLGIAEQVHFAGPRRDGDVVDALNSATLLAVPSAYEEPFGIVALEGIACGCVVIASAGGGLPEAVGPCGVTFPNGDAATLARRIAELLHDARLRRQLRGGAAAHLAEFTAAAIARRYLALFESVLARSAQ